MLNMGWGGALRIFYDMRLAGMVPDGITYIGALTACSYTGKVEEGKIFLILWVKILLPSLDRSIILVWLICLGEQDIWMKHCI
jgi:hypothetical protein